MNSENHSGETFSGKEAVAATLTAREDLHRTDAEEQGRQIGVGDVMTPLKSYGFNLELETIRDFYRRFDDLGWDGILQEVSERMKTPERYSGYLQAADTTSIGDEIQKSVERPLGNGGIVRIAITDEDPEQSLLQIEPKQDDPHFHDQDRRWYLLVGRRSAFHEIPLGSYLDNVFETPIDTDSGEARCLRQNDVACLLAFRQGDNGTS